MFREVELVGDRELLRFFKESPEESARMFSAAMYEEATEAFGQSQELVPVRYGILRASGFVSAPKMVGSRSETTISYGGAAAPYAAHVHEITKYRHDAPTRSKFLSHPLERRFPVLGERLKQRLQNMIAEYFKRMA